MTHHTIGQPLIISWQTKCTVLQDNYHRSNGNIEVANYALPVSEANSLTVAVFKIKMKSITTKK